jgi:signal transduction histidine kinase
MLPSLTERFLTTADGESYRVAVTREGQPPVVLYESEANAAVDLDQSVALQLLQPVRRNPQVLLPKWQLYVQHRAGVVEQAVMRLRYRNLGVSLSILVLLFASIVLLVTSSRRVQRLGRQQIEMAAGVSHELRTPIAVIRSAADNLSHGIISGERVHYYGELIDAEARRLGNVVEQALLYAGIASGRGTTVRVPLAPATLIHAALDATARAFRIAQLDCTIAPDLPYVAGDAVALQSALENLIANAVKYGGPSGWVGVRAEASSGLRPEVRITIQDRGPGISPDDLPHIFEPFYRGKATASHQASGSGLGLALVRQIVVAHGGRITVVTPRQGGTAFTVALPALARENESRHVSDASLAQVTQGSRPA